MMHPGMTERRWPAYAMLLLSLLIAVGAWIVRSESILSVAAAFGAILWFTQVPGTLLLLLFNQESGGRLRLLLLGQGVGLAMAPILHIVLHAVGLRGEDLLAQTVVNCALAAALLRRGRSGSIREVWGPIATPTLVGISVLVLAVVGSVAVREMLIFHENDLVVRSVQEVDAGYLIGLVNGIREHGSLIDVNGGGVPMEYHYFLYLLMAMVGGASGAENLTVFQAVFPLYLFFLLALATYGVVRFAGGSIRAAVLGGLLILFLNDLSILNNLVGAASGGEAYTIVYATLNLAYLHGSPSWIASIAIVMILLCEIVRAQKLDGRIVRWIPFILIASVLPGYKVPAWMCLVGGLGLASLLLVRRRPGYLIVSILSGVGGILVLVLCVGISTGQSAVGRMLIGYPVLRNDAVQKLAGVGGHSFSIDGMTPGLLVLIVVLIPTWLLLTYGIRIVWMARATRRFGALLREANLLELTVLLSIAVGLAIALFAAPERTPLLVYYNCLFGLLVTTPFTAIVLDEYLRRLSSLARLAVVGLVLVQMSSGFLYLAKPLLQKKNIADLRGPWLDAMTYLRRETPPDALLLSNRYGFSTDPAFGTYSEQFYFVPAFSHRSVAVSGNRYYLQVGAEYDRRRRLADSLFGARSGERIRDLSDSLGIDYIVFDKWKGERFAGNDPRYLEQVFSNKQVDIYKVRRDATALPVRSDSTTTSER